MYIKKFKFNIGLTKDQYNMADGGSKAVVVATEFVVLPTSYFPFINFLLNDLQLQQIIKVLLNSVSLEQSICLFYFQAYEDEDENNPEGFLELRLGNTVQDALGPKLLLYRFGSLDGQISYQTSKPCSILVPIRHVFLFTVLLGCPSLHLL